MKIGIISDHRAVKLRKEIISNLTEYEFIDLGTEIEDAELVYYPDYAFLLGKEIVNKKVDIGIAICGNGIGMSIALNKVSGVRCGKVNNVKEIIEARDHNNINALAFGSEVDINTVREYIKAMIQTPFSTKNRYQVRYNKITQYENGEYYER